MKEAPIQHIDNKKEWMEDILRRQCEYNLQDILLVCNAANETYPQKFPLIYMMADMYEWEQKGIIVFPLQLKQLVDQFHREEYLVLWKGRTIQDATLEMADFYQAFEICMELVPALAELLLTEDVLAWHGVSYEITEPFYEELRRIRNMDI